MVGPQRKKPGLPLARSLLSTFIADPPPSSHPQAHRGRGKGRGRGARGANAKRNPVRPPSPPPAVASPTDERVEDEPVSHSPVSERVEDEPVSHSTMSKRVEEERLSSEAFDEEGLTSDKEALTSDEEHAGFIQVEEGRSVYQRGSSSLLEQGFPVEQRPCIAPCGET